VQTLLLYEKNILRLGEGEQEITTNGVFQFRKLTLEKRKRLKKIRTKTTKEKQNKTNGAA